MTYITKESALQAIADYQGGAVDKTVAREIIEGLPDAWIPCSERLPDEMTYVLVTDKDGDVYSVKFIEVIDGQAEWVFDNGIIAWMPLPEPYKEENNG